MTIEDKVAAIAARLAEAAAAVPGVRVERGGAAVRISARGLARRRLDEPLLRVPGALL